MPHALLFRLAVLAFVLLGAGCAASPVVFVPLDDDYTPSPRPDDAQVVLNRAAVERPHRVIGIIEAQLGQNATREALNDLLRRKAREVGADGLMLVEYDVDLDVYYTRHRAVVGPRGRTRVQRAGRRFDVEKRAVGTAIVFD